MPALDSIAQDLRIAVRGLVRHRAFSIVAALTLAIGIGANTAVFSVVNGVLLNPLPYPAADELVLLNVEPTGTGTRPGSVSYPDLADIRDNARSFRTLVGVNGANMTLTGLGDPVILDVSRVTEGVLATFGLAPVRGRDILREEFGINRPLVVVIGYDIWQDRFGGANDVIGKSIVLNSSTYEIVGIAPQGFAYPARTSLWIPRALDLSGCGRGCHTMQVIGRLAQDVPLAAAIAEAQQFGVTLERDYPATNTAKRFIVRDFKAALVGDVKQGLWILLGAAGLVLLIACANVANLLLARASSREGEITVRAALGATRARLAAQVLAESAVLAVVGGAAGIALAFGGVAALRSLVSDTIPRAELIAIDGTVLVVSLAAIVLVMFIFGAIPEFATSRASITGGLARVGRGGAATSATVRFRRALLTGEVALSASLLVGAGLLLRTFTQLYAVDVGFTTSDITRFSVVLSEANYPTIDRATQFYDALGAEIAALPGVEGVGAMFGQPLGRSRATGSALVEGRPEPAPGTELEASVRAVTPELLPTIRIPLKRGRLLTPADNQSGAEPVALVNEEFVRQHFPGDDPLGKRVNLSVDFGYGSPYWRIVGVVGDVRFNSITERANADVYVPHALFGPLSLTVHVRTAPGAPAVMAPIRDVVRRLDPSIALFRVETLEQVMGTATAPTRIYFALVALFAVVAALLAAVGLYGVMSYLVVQRTREIGIRVALGARRERIIGLVVRQGMQPAIVGLIIGIGGALAAGRFVESLLYGVRPNDPIVLVAAACLMIVVALLAVVVPAIRASGIDPAGVLHGE